MVQLFVWIHGHGHEPKRELIQMTPCANANGFVITITAKTDLIERIKRTLQLFGIYRVRIKRNIFKQVKKFVKVHGRIRGHVIFPSIGNAVHIGRGLLYVR